MAKDYIKIAKKYMNDVLAGKIDACEYVKLACRRQAEDLKRKWDFEFDPKRAVRPCKFIELLKHVKGPKAGENIILEPWQIFIVTTIFGWVHKISRIRRFLTVYIEIPRSNGKSCLASAIAIYMLCADGEKGPDVFSFAVDKEQAKIVYDDAVAMINGNPALEKAFGIKVLSNCVKIKSTNGTMKPMSSESKKLDGLKPHCAVIDELHAHTSRKVWDLVKKSLNKREQPLLFAITTAGYNLQGICMEIRTTVAHILEGLIKSDSIFGIIYTADTSDPWDDLATIKKANPNFGISLQERNVLEDLELAKLSVQGQNDFKTKQLNIWCNSNSQWLDIAKWDKCKSDLTMSDFIGSPCIVGMDLASKIDLCSLVYVFWKYNDLTDNLHFYAFQKSWIPEERVRSSKNVFYGNWVKAGLLKTNSGEITDYNQIEAEIEESAKLYDILCIAYDPAQATMISQNLINYGLNMVELSQTMRNISEPMKLVQALIYSARLHNTGDPLFRWQAGNVVAHIDAKENIYPRKEKGVGDPKIDSMMALIMAFNQIIQKDIENTYMYYNNNDEGMNFNDIVLDF